MRIDSHLHFWKYNIGKRDWITNEMTALQKDFLPQTIQPVLEQHQIAGCVAVQSFNSESDTDFLLQQAATNHFIKGIIGWTDLQANNIEEKLAGYSRNSLIKGFRHIPEAADKAMMISPTFKSGVALLSKNGFAYDILADVEELRYAYQLAAQLPNQPFVIDHMGKPAIGGNNMADWKRNISLFAPLENVYCKVPGITASIGNAEVKLETVTPYLDVVVETFGAKRLMYGSNWPVCLLKAEYDTIWNLTGNYFQSFSDEEKDGIFGENASHFYNL